MKPNTYRDRLKEFLDSPVDGVPPIKGLKTFNEVLGALVWCNHQLAARLVVLERSVAEQCLKDGGTWNPQKVFRPNDLATYRGAAWVCKNQNSNVRPGTNDDWRLLHKTI